MIPRRIFMLIDACLIIVAFMVAHALTPSLRPARDGFVGLVQRGAPSLAARLQPGTAELVPLSQLLWILLVITPAVLLALLVVDAYGQLHHISRTRMVVAGPLAAVTGLSLAVLVIFLLRVQEQSRLFLFTFTALTAIALTSVRAFIRAYHQWQARAGYYRRDLVLVGPAEAMPRLVAFIRSRWSLDDFSIVGFVEPSPSPRTRDGPSHGPWLANASVAASGAVAVLLPAVGDSPDVAGCGGATGLMPRCLGSVMDIEEVLLRHPAHEVVVLQSNATAWVTDVVGACDHAGVPLRLVSEVLLSYSPVNLVATEGGRHGRKLPSMLLAPRTFDMEALHLKRLIDVIVSAVAVVALAPLFGVIALLVRLSGRPILYRYQMVGQNGRHFVGCKFRTMVPNANALKPTLLALNEMSGPVFKMKNDPRITKVGRWLRKFSLDELPQLSSVLKGDLSLVGPRPAGPDEFERYRFWQMRKVSVKPGITCLWQIRGRNGISSFDQWVRMDLEYIDNWSLWLDFKILAQTVLVVIKGTGR